MIVCELKINFVLIHPMKESLARIKLLFACHKTRQDVLMLKANRELSI